MDALRPYWHAVADATKIADKPVPVQLLDERIVLYRANGELVAFEDLCLHRGVRLSLGWVKDDRIVCGYHGWQYEPSGRCVRIPSQPPDASIPNKAKAKKYQVQERYGLAWVCLEHEPAAPIPEFPQEGFPVYGAPGTRAFMMEFEWDVNAARMTENSMDHSHFPFVHPGVLGDPERPEYPDVHVDLYDGGMRYRIPNHPNNSVRNYRLTLPFTLEIAVDESDPVQKTTMLFPACPMTSKRTRHWFISVRNYDLETPDHAFMERDKAVFFQDREIVENQHPEELPLDLREELHLKRADKPALEFRRMLNKMGVEWL